MPCEKLKLFQPKIFDEKFRYINFLHILKNFNVHIFNISKFNFSNQSLIQNIRKFLAEFIHLKSNVRRNRF